MKEQNVELVVKTDTYRVGRHSKNANINTKAQKKVGFVQHVSFNNKRKYEPGPVQGFFY